MECIYLSVLISLLPVLNGVERTTVEDYTNTCLDGKYHKSKPGPESELFSHCEPWKKRSCCTHEVTNKLHISDAWYNFKWDHCGALSPNCLTHFFQDLCFYECSPNTGPWLQPVNMKIRKEKVMHAPLCETDCNNWWEDCKDDLTCTDNWGKNFNWSTGVSRCPTGSTCRKISEVFSNSSNFCETIWNYSWKVVPETEKCMHLWFDANQGNPNDAVALARAKEIVNSSLTMSASSGFIFLILSSLLLFLLIC